ncbi:hypothetical protein B0H16DRAFT_1690795 [Mycena metata]|uniref:Uncharacterized protein n=1 Tax=Mycena metata TaxID=1033252 RepID=A0AAD7IZ00_9AGAR|nr:hypothetical protein B0H16DRAFT_1690795 [Mycena metata]
MANSIPLSLNIISESLGVLPYTGGVHPVKPNDLILYYDEQHPRRIDFTTAAEQDLADLDNVCGTIVSEGHNEIPEMNIKTLNTKFATRFDLAGSGLLDTISPDFLETLDSSEGQSLRAEMYELNVYGPGSYMKANKNIAGGDGMVGNLIIVFPPTYTGGTLSLIHEESWVFAPPPCPAGTLAVQYVLFRSDVMRAVEPVHAGYRVALTYNIFLTTPGSNATLSNRITPTHERAFEDTLRMLLANPSFLPDGGFLAYGPAHGYPLPLTPYAPESDEADMMPPNQISPILELLKGRDQCVKLLYATGYNMEGHDVLLDKMIDLEGVHEGIEDEDEGCGTADEIIEEEGVVLLRGEERLAAMRDDLVEFGGIPSEDEYEQPIGGVAVHWMTRVTPELNRVKSEYLGEDGMICDAFGDAVLVVPVPAFGVGVRTVAE